MSTTNPVLSPYLQHLAVQKLFDLDVLEQVNALPTPELQEQALDRYRERQPLLVKKIVSEVLDQASGRIIQESVPDRLANAMGEDLIDQYVPGIGKVGWELRSWLAETWRSQKHRSWWKWVLALWLLPFAIGLVVWLVSFPFKGGTYLWDKVTARPPAREPEPYIEPSQESEFAPEKNDSNAPAVPHVSDTHGTPTAKQRVEGAAVGDKTTKGDLNALPVPQVPGTSGTSQQPSARGIETVKDNREVDSLPPPSVASLPPPAVVHVRFKTPDLVHISWQAVSKDARYNVYSSGDRALTRLRKENDVPLKSNALDWTADTGFDQYWFVVTTIDPEGHESGYSETVQVVH